MEKHGQADTETHIAKKTEIYLRVGERERERERETDRQTDKQRERQTARQTNRGADRDRESVNKSSMYALMQIFCWEK